MDLTEDNASVKHDNKGLQGIVKKLKEEKVDMQQRNAEFKQKNMHQEHELGLLRIQRDNLLKATKELKKTSREYELLQEKYHVLLSEKSKLLSAKFDVDQNDWQAKYEELI